MAGATGAQLSAERLVQAHRAMLQTPGLQFDFHAMPVEKVPPWLLALGRFLEGLGPLIRILFWGGVALAALAIVVLIGREVWRSRWPKGRGRPAAPVGADWRPTAQAARSLLEEADRLAAEGAF
ncbi:MAG: hypothetical protein ABI655_15050, partial [Phenylobacterium sp.]